MAYGYLNKMSYVYSPEAYWTISPGYFDSVRSAARSWRLESDGSINFADVTTSYTVRPVINLKANTEISCGIGTKNDPFIIKTN